MPGVRIGFVRLTEVPLHVNSQVLSATPRGGGLELRLSDGDARLVDHLLFGTGYRVDIARYPFLSGELLAAIRRVDGFPVLSRGLESSVPGLHFLGAPAAWSFGPIMRFVSGSWYAGRQLTRSVAGRARAGGAPAMVAPHIAVDRVPQPEGASPSS